MLVKIGLSLILLIFIGIIFLAVITQYSETSSYHGPVSDHFDGKLFHNSPPYKIKTFKDVFHWWRTRGSQPWPNHVENSALPDLAPVSNSSIKATFVNHATVLIQTRGLTVLTDPIWSERASPFRWIGPKRVREPGVGFAELPAIDVVLISHNHYDHLDIPTLKQLESAFHPTYLVPLGLKDFLTRKGLTHVIEMDWWQTVPIQQAVITLLPVQHWSQRSVTDRFQTLWGSFGIEVNGRKIYFGGDAGYSDHFKQISQKWGKPDVAFLAIGSYLPEWFMQQNHLNPAEAVQAYQDLKARYAVGIHFGTFKLSEEAIDQPVKDLKGALELQHLSDQDFRVLKVGESHLF